MSEASSPAARTQRLSRDFLEEYRSSSRYQRGMIDEIAELALSPSHAEAAEATRTLFTALIEPMADSFDPAAVALYNRVFAQLVQACRRREPPLDSELKRLGLTVEQDLVDRAESLRPSIEVDKPLGASHAPAWRRVKRAIVLSRVTLGADVAITSVIIERLKREMTNAEIVLAGGKKVVELFGGDDRLSFHEVGYQRSAPLRDRVLSWLGVLSAVRGLTAGFDDSEWVIVDPDSRLTQLGVLPLTHHSNAGRYFFFPSREFGHETTYSMGELVSQWAGELFREKHGTIPRVSLKKDDAESGERLLGALRRSGARRVAAVNFGVGDNPAKRIDGDFETSLVLSLLRDGAAVILDKGAGGDESDRIDVIVAGARADRTAGDALRVLEIDEAALPAVLAKQSLEADVVVWRGGIGLLGALINNSDCYIGYDSAGQHIAAALGVPCINVVAGAPSMRFVQRWKPVGPSEVNVVVADGSRTGAQLLNEVMGHWRRICAR